MLEKRTVSLKARKQKDHSGGSSHPAMPMGQKRIPGNPYGLAQRIIKRSLTFEETHLITHIMERQPALSAREVVARALNRGRAAKKTVDLVSGQLNRELTKQEHYFLAELAWANRKSNPANLAKGFLNLTTKLPKAKQILVSQQKRELSIEEEKWANEIALTHSQLTAEELARTISNFLLQLEQARKTRK
ncbi:MAG: hypothetical protein Q7S92_05915 [Candidatus Diapherotrites archaeon]|nr:hypothetical protein [Candidatus Diapherotrites archaeon]